MKQMKSGLLFLTFACATAPRGELYERPASPAARVEVIELGWNAVEDPQANHPPVVDLMRPVRYRGQVLEQANDLAAQCNDGSTSFAALMRKSGADGSAGPVAVDPGSKLAYRDAALRLRVGECAMVEGPAADYVVKRVE
jgi:hypothetical protein